MSVSICCRWQVQGDPLYFVGVSLHTLLHLVSFQRPWDLGHVNQQRLCLLKEEVRKLSFIHLAWHLNLYAFWHSERCHIIK